MKLSAAGTNYNKWYHYFTNAALPLPR